MVHWSIALGDLVLLVRGLGHRAKVPRKGKGTFWYVGAKYNQNQGSQKSIFERLGMEGMGAHTDALTHTKPLCAQILFLFTLGKCCRFSCVLCALSAPDYHLHNCWYLQHSDNSLFFNCSLQTRSSLANWDMNLAAAATLFYFIHSVYGLDRCHSTISTIQPYHVEQVCMYPRRFYCFPPIFNLSVHPGPTQWSAYRVLHEWTPGSK